MGKIKVFLCMFFALFGAIVASGQTLNKLSISTVPSPIGKVIQIPIQLENTDEIVAAQFDIVVPNEISILNEAVSTNRWDDHVAVVTSLGNGRSRVMVYSPSNKPLKGNSGNLIMLKARVSESCVEGEEYPVNLSDIVLAKGNGDNSVTACQNGKFVILKSPDLTPEWISINKTAVNPTDTIQCSWRVKNIGGLSTTGGWKEQVFAVSNDGKCQFLLGSQYNGNTISSQGEIIRSMDIAVPEVLGMDGRCSLMIKIVPDANCGEPVSMIGNNACQSDQLINVAKSLYLDDIKSAVDESSATPLKYKLTRSGSIQHSETFTVNVKHPDSRVTFPATVEIPLNQSSAYFYVTLAANGKLDESDSVDFSITGNEYPEISSVLSIIDDTFPKLNAVLSKLEVTEGESFILTIELPRTFAEDNTIFLSSDNSAKIKVPSEIVIPAGQTSVPIPLSVIDNDDAELETTVTIRAASDGMDSEDCEVLVLDNDMPTLSLTFSPSEVSENAGVSAVVATVKRLTNVDKNVKLLLFDDSNGAIELSHKTLSMGKGTESIQFLIDVKDNDIVDGDKRYNVTVAVYSSACDCYASELSGGYVSQELTVLDDDGPHLSITSASQAFLEGSSDNIITISRNTTPDSDITVNLSSDKDDFLDYNHTVVIPAGATSADVNVSVLSNETFGDGDIVSFKAESADMAIGSCWVVITDRTLPDATIQLEVAQESPSAGECIDLILTISNIGNAPLQRNTPIDIKCTGINGAKRVYTKKAIEKGDNERFVIEDFQLPERTGLVTLSAVINDNESVTELLYSNNNAKTVELTLTPAFEVTATVDKNIYLQEDDVRISGHASGEAGKNAKIEIHLSDNGVLQVLNTTTDDNGNYEYTHKLLARQTGHFTVSACYPTSTPTDASATFDVYGLQLNKAFITCEPGLGETFNGTFRLSNPGNMPQNSIQIEKVSTPTNCEFTFEAPSTIGAGETVDINFSLKGTGLSSGKEFEKIPLSITTAEGAKTTFTVYYYVQSLHGKLYTSTPTISTTMLKDTPRDYPLVIRNIGKGETGKITFALPSWVETATPREMASLAAGDSTTVVLRFKPMDEMKLNVATKGKLGVNCKNGDGISVSFDIMPVSEAIGKLKVDVVDEFTFYTAEAPHVSNALIKITHPTSKETIAEGRTGNDGIFTAEIQEGWYIMSVEADNHDIYTENIIINPGAELLKEVFMPYQAITYNWTVEETEIEDEYVFETTVDFDTRVPKPVIVISLPDEKPEPYSVIPVKITNKGLINAVNIEMSLEVSDGYTLEFLNDPTAEVLAPQQTLIFYAKLIPTDSSSDVRAKAPRANRECIWIISKAKYQELCQKYTGDQFVRMLKKYGKKSCFNSGSVSGGHGGGSYGGSYGGVGRPGCWGGSSYDSDYYVIDWSNPEKYCDRKPGANPMDRDDNDPIDLPLVDDGDPDEQDCSEVPELHFKLIPVAGRRYEMKGVAADGVSQVRIVLDPRTSKIPRTDCVNFTDFKWELSKNVGTIEPISSWEAIYTAPEDYPEEYGKSTNIDVKLRYSQRTSDNTTYGRVSEPVSIEIIRPPLILIHGLNDKGYNPKRLDEGCWSLLYHILDIRYNDFNITRMDYSASHSSAFETNLSLVNQEIKKMQRNTKANGFISTKCDLVGHSMGGILSRQHVQHYGDEFVNKLITVNTPHSGSEIGDAVKAHKYIIGNLARLFTWDTDIDAIYDLAVESDAINNLNSGVDQKYDVAVHSIATETNLVLPALIATGQYTLGEIGNKLITKWPWGTLFGLLFKYSAHFIDDVSQVGNGDMVVSTESQIGGCGSNASTVIYNGPWHCKSPSNPQTIESVMTLLNASKNSTVFSKNWFNPNRRLFDHSAWWALQEAAQTAPDILLDEGFNLKFVEIKDTQNLEKWANDKEKWEKIKGVVNGIKNGAQVSQEIVDFSDTHTPKRSYVNNENREGYNCNVIHMPIPSNDLFSDYSAIFRFEDSGEEFVDGDSEIKCIVPSTFSGNVQIIFMAKLEGEVVVYDQFDMVIENPLTQPIRIESKDIILESGESRPLKVSCVWEDDSETELKPETVVFGNSKLAKFENGIVTGLNPGLTIATITCNGMTTTCKVRVFASSDDNASNDSDAICSTVSLSFKQSAVMTRQAFRGVFSLNNGHQTATLRDFKLNLEVKDEDGVVATKREFEITPEKLAGFQGNLDFNSGWSLEPSLNGEASILFIPTKYAAPTEPKEYSFGGTFSYIDPYTGLTVTRTLNPVTLTVNPSPQLELIYFMQRDVFGDDPLTEEIEPMKQAEFALLLKNVGSGDATNLKLTTGQPQIVSNEKGLYINFELICSQLNGDDKSLMLGGGAVTDFGSLKAGKQSYAQWWLQSSLLGHFVKYDVKSTHVTSHDNPNLSLVDTVTIHELIHGFDLIENDIKRRAFLVNDIADVLDTPDQLYFTDGTQADVTTARDASISKQNDLEYILNVSASVQGWNYGTISDPTNGRQNLSSIKRMSDGTELAIDNFWQTDRTLRDGKEPLAENRLHFIDNFSNGDASYLLTFTPKPDIELTVDSVIGLPDEDEILTEQLKTVTVKFNKPIDRVSFTIEDLSLSCQGERLDVSTVTISSKTDTEYLIDLSTVTLDNGFYVFSIQTSTISDTEGFSGIAGKQVSWIQYVDGKVKMTTMAMPAEGGTVMPQTGLYDYETSITLKAMPSDGYIFLGWWCGDELISEATETEVTLTEDKNYSARFALKQFKISVDCNGDGGYVDGTATGIYDFGNTVRVEAIPNYGWSFSHWTIDGADITDGSNILELSVDHDTEIYATFVSHIKELAIPLQQGWNWISSVFDDKNLHNPMLFFKSIKPSLTEVRANDGNLILNDGIFDGSIERMIPGTYKIKVNNSTSLRLKGATVFEDNYVVNLSQGWTWIPYIPVNEMNITEALADLSAQENDILKSHTQFAVFSDGRWLGPLKSFVPNEGYMYYASASTSFKFPLSVVASSYDSNCNNAPWQYNERKFADNKTIVANICDNGTPVTEDNYIVGAFCGDECRGFGEFIEGFYFITIHGQQGDDISFKVIDNKSGEERDVNESLSFDDNPLGTISNPFNLNLDKSLGINNILVGYGLKITPNPVKDIMYIEGDISNVKSVKVITTSGITLISTDSFEHGVNVSSIPDGVYVAAILTTHGITYREFLKKGY